jgi:ABC-type sulfate/molybdate transport systems ATPase subunit
VADRPVVLMNKGKIEQIGSPQEVGPSGQPVCVCGFWAM